MTDYKNELKKNLLLADDISIKNNVLQISSQLSEKHLAHFLVDTIFFKVITQLIQDDIWLHSKKLSNDLRIDQIIQKHLKLELKSFIYIHAFFADFKTIDPKITIQRLNTIQITLLDYIKSKNYIFKKSLLTSMFSAMSELYELEHQIRNNPQNQSDDTQMSLYRSFDAIDDILGIKYLTNEANTLNQKERLYEGAGIGVQSSYATTLIALRYLNLKKDSLLIDLGSGYGRIGLIIGLMRPDIRFVGYEYVEDRVKSSNLIAKNFEIDNHVQFFTQDLSEPEYKIPKADTYYIFDSFTDSTYTFILNQLEQISLSKRITIVTKGNARLWFNSSFWSCQQQFNDGNICFFRSNARIS